MFKIIYIVTLFNLLLYSGNTHSTPHNSYADSVTDKSHTINRVHNHHKIYPDKSNQMGLQLPIQPIQTIVIDPGHGGKDSGCIGEHSLEKDIVLEVSKKLGKKINAVFPDIKVIYTRKTDKFIPLHGRAEIANSNNADLFISIHCNYVSGKESVFGTETFVLGLHRSQDNLAVVMRENSVIYFEDNYKENYQGFGQSSPENLIIQSMYQEARLRRSIALATYIEHEFENDKNRKSRGVKQAGFHVIRQTAMPSVLVELGFLSNSREERYLMSDAGQEEVIHGFIVALSHYIDYLKASASNPHPQQDVLAAQASSVPENHSEELEDSSETTYTIQLIATSSKIPKSHEIFRLINDIKVVKAGNLFKYYAGKYEDEDSAQERLYAVHHAGYKDAFITRVHAQ